MDKIGAGYQGGYADEDFRSGELKNNYQRLSELQALMYAENKNSLLIVLQAMDGGGKDGAIRHVMGAITDRGVSWRGLKFQPQEELAAIIISGASIKSSLRKEQITVFNRSHYEDILVVRVHNLVPKEVWSKRYNRSMLLKGS